MPPCDCQTPHTGTGHAPVPPPSSLQAFTKSKKGSSDKTNDTHAYHASSHHTHNASESHDLQHRDLLCVGIKFDIQMVKLAGQGADLSGALCNPPEIFPQASAVCGTAEIPSTCCGLPASIASLVRFFRPAFMSFLEPA